MHHTSTGTSQKLQKMKKNEHKVNPRSDLMVQEFKYRPRGDVPTLAEVCDVGLFSRPTGTRTHRKVLFMVEVMR